MTHVLENRSQSPRSNDIDARRSDSYSRVAGLWVDKKLQFFIDEQVLPGAGIIASDFWRSFSELIGDLAPKNRGLLDTRNYLQRRIDEWHRENRENPIDHAAYRSFLESINYICAPVDDFKIGTENVDDEIAVQAGPQLVVPLKNARFALNAANARWGSLYDAIYGTDLIEDAGSMARGSAYNPRRGAEVIAKGREFLDSAAPLATSSHANARGYLVESGALRVTSDDGASSGLLKPEQLLGYRGPHDAPTAILLQHNELRFEIQLDRSTEIGGNDLAGISDILMEAAITTIMDCEDSVAAVDAEDKLEVYQNWLGLVKGSLSASFSKGGKTVERRLNPDRLYTDPHGDEFSIPGRSLLFIRNVGHLMTNPAILFDERHEIPEGIMDAVITSLIALHDIKSCNDIKNSRKKSIYIVKPKMHGPQEVAFTNTLFDRVEQMLDLKRASIKLGIMDEERRTTLNLKSCINEAKDRCVFINTGFLDRTGDEIHTSMQAGAVVPKTQMKQQAWIQAYEKWNVDTGLDCGFRGRAQIGKGMWPMPDRMSEMLEAKIAHPQAGANTAWVPSPTAAVLHAMHYHQVSVPTRQKMMEEQLRASGGEMATEECFSQLLSIPLIADRQALSPDIIRAEIDNNCQGILGYVVRWIDQGVGCSKVPDIHNVGLMEDRATLRISSQHLANWLLHGICKKSDVENALRRMAVVVDEQNATDENYQAMSPEFEKSLAFRAASELIFKGIEQPNGYTEPLLHSFRQEKKKRDRQSTLN